MKILKRAGSRFLASEAAKEITGLVFFNVGRALGDQVYLLYNRPGRGLHDANSFLIGFLKRWRLARDAAIFGAVSEMGGLELVCRVVAGRLLEVFAAESGEEAASKLLKGLIHRYYERVKRGYVKVEERFSEPFYEFIITLPMVVGGGEAEMPSEVLGEDGWE